MSERPTIVLFVMGAKGHVQRMLPVADALVARGVTTWVVTDREFAPQIQRRGAKFMDLYAGHSLADADGHSRPVASRYVSFAGHFGREVAQRVAPLRPSVIVSDSFAVVGRVVARILDTPYVGVCSGHDMDPATFTAQLEPERISTGARCIEAVRILQDELGFSEATPFWYGTSVSALLNLYCEPEAFISPGTRRSLEPIDFFGSLPSDATERRGRPEDADAHRPPRVYASFGTVSWWYYADLALRSLRTIAEAADRAGFETVISLGNADIAAGDLAGLHRSRVSVRPYVDQWELLQWADVFVTHQGLNSTHEAIFTETAMLSHPFFHDQPSMAAACQALGVALPLAPGLRHDLARADVEQAFAAWRAGREQLQAALATAKALELEVIRHRPTVIDRVVALTR